MNNRDLTKSVWGGLSSHNIFENIISLKNLFSAWERFKKGKENKRDVLEFEDSLEDNIFTLHRELHAGGYNHSHYTSFFLCDPKLRSIHKAKVRDRILHHAIVDVIELIFEKIFIFDSYSSRKNKGTHRAIKRFQTFAWKLSRNNTKTVWVLKCDIKKFFDSVDHEKLLALVKEKICDKKSVALIENIVRSFNRAEAKGIPLGNLTSQLFSNIYLNELDSFVKQNLHVKYYIRYADDFVVLSRDKEYLQNVLDSVDKFLSENLKLSLHWRKVSICRWHSGIDFLGYVLFPHYSVLRTKTKNRILKNIRKKRQELLDEIIGEDKFEQTYKSYLGVLKHCRSWGIKSDMKL